ncbi:MAG: glycosyltransferase family 39 protein [Phycisphaerae bacterium]|nr:glycosyltransferase family 39 protein [Phycisphaerae bacterium]
MPQEAEARCSASPPLGGSLTWIDGLLAIVLGAIGMTVLVLIVRFVSPCYMSFSDCVPYIMQTHIFIEGRLTRDVPPDDVAPCLTTIGMIRRDGREFSRQPPGAPAVFAGLTVIVRDPRWAPPAATALAILFSYLWIARAYDRKTAVWATVLCLFGPVYLLTGPASLSYAPSALFLSIAMLCFVLSVEKRSIPWALLCGLAIGLQFTNRPYTTVLATGGLAVTRLLVIRNGSPAAKQMLAFTVGLLPGIGLLLIHNRLVIGDFWPLAFTLYDSKDKLGFGVRGLDAATLVHTPVRAIHNLIGTLNQAGLMFFGFYIWLVPIGTWLLGRTVARGRWSEGRLTRWDIMAVVMILAMVIGHMAYWCPRVINYYEAYPFLAVLVVRGLRDMMDRGCLMRLLAGGICAFTMIVGPVLIHAWLSSTLARHRKVHAAIAEALEQHGKILVFSRPLNQRLGEPSSALRSQDLLCTGMLNTSVTPGQPVIYAVDHGPLNESLIARYPDHYPLLLLTEPEDPNDPDAGIKVGMTPLRRSPRSAPGRVD